MKSTDLEGRISMNLVDQDSELKEPLVPQWRALPQPPVSSQMDKEALMISGRENLEKLHKQCMQEQEIKRSLYLTS